MPVLIGLFILTTLFLFFYQFYFWDLENLEKKYAKIPKIIIQTWKTDDIPLQYKPLVQSVKDYNPEYTYLFFTDKDIDDFFKKHYLHYYNTYQNLPIKIQKIDFFRYVAIYHYGGIYLDLDMEILENFDDLLVHDIVFPVDDYISQNMKYNKRNNQRYKYFLNNNQCFLLGQYAFASTPKHPFMKKIINNIHNNLQKIIKNVNQNDNNYVYTTTGPDYITKLYMSELTKSNIEILHCNKRQCFGTFGKHKFFGSWK